VTTVPLTVPWAIGRATGAIWTNVPSTMDASCNHCGPSPSARPWGRTLPPRAFWRIRKKFPLLRQRIPAKRPFRPHPIPWIAVNIVTLAAPRCLVFWSRPGVAPDLPPGMVPVILRGPQPSPRRRTQRLRLLTAPTNRRTPLSGRWTFFTGAPQDVQVVDDLVP
jgi:hypothetical protein